MMQESAGPSRSARHQLYHMKMSPRFKCPAARKIDRHLRQQLSRWVIQNHNSRTTTITERFLQRLTQHMHNLPRCDTRRFSRSPGNSSSTESTMGHNLVEHMIGLADTVLISFPPLASRSSSTLYRSSLVLRSTNARLGRFRRAGVAVSSQCYHHCHGSAPIPCFRPAVMGRTVTDAATVLHIELSRIFR